MKPTTKHFLLSNIRQLKQMLVLFLPKSKEEIIILLTLILFYSSYSFYITLNTSVIDNTHITLDTYFSFDAPTVYKKGYHSVTCHPIMRFLLSPVILIGNILADVFDNYKAKTIFWTAICILFISFSIIYVFRYLKEIIKLDKKINYLLIIFFATTSTCLILCFTPESYPVSMFLLTFTLYYYSYCIKNKQKAYFFPNVFLAGSLGGLTITNFSFGVIPMFFTKDSLIITLKKILIIILLAAPILIFYQWKYDCFTRSLYILNMFSEPFGEYYERAIDLFFGAPVFFPKVISYYATIYDRNEYGIYTDFYHHWWQYLFVGLLFILLVFSFVKNYANRLVWIILLYLIVNVFIHLILKFGIAEPMIYGGHWVYLIPLLLGWLYKSINQKYRNFLFQVLSLMTLGMIINNLIQMKNFINEAFNIFPAV